jgi:hypothetical protein
MGTKYGSKISFDSLYFCADSSSSAFYKNNSIKDLNGNNSLVPTNCIFTQSGFYFTNPLSGTPTPTSYAKSASFDDTFRMVTGKNISAFVFFYNTTLLDPSAQVWYLQEPFAWGGDVTLGGWNFKRGYRNQSMQLTYKFDQDGTYGSNADFGIVPINDWTQLGFIYENGYLKTYNNGILTGNLNLTTRTMTGAFSTSVRVALGSMGYSDSNYYGFNGFIANAAFYTKALTQDEIDNNLIILRKRIGL